MSGKKKDIVSKEIEQVEREILADRYNTALKKMQFVNELKNGLGSELKNNPNKIKLVKKSFWAKIKDYLKGLFTKF